MIEARGLTVRYPEAYGLRGVDLSIERGEFVLIGGPSGGGKSTLAHTLIGLIPETIPARVTGDITVAGMDPRRRRVAQMARRVGLVSQNPASQLFNGTATEEAAFGLRNLGFPPHVVAERTAWALAATGCQRLRERAVRRLSSGEQQRVAIAAILAMAPAILILDEPTANLDGAGVRTLTQTLARLRRRSDITMLVIEHHLEPFLPHADRLIWLADGEALAQGAPAAVWSRVRPALSPPPCTPKPSDEILVEMRDVAVGYDGPPLIESCSMALRRGDFAALVGPNGAGKTTLARALSGLLKPRRGRVVWSAGGLGRRGRRVGLVQQNPLHQLVCDTVEEEVCFGPQNLGTIEAVDVKALLARVGLADLRRRPNQALSVGQQQRTALAATLSLCPELLILDEPTVGQDWGHLIRLMNLLSELNCAGQTVLLITHRRELVARYANRVWRLADGRVVSSK